MQSETGYREPFSLIDLKIIYLESLAVFQKTAKDLPRPFWYAQRSTILSNNIQITLYYWKIQTTPAIIQVGEKCLSS
jgi:hypothetical protein